jgi:hypothetical protein
MAFPYQDPVRNLTAALYLSWKRWFLKRIEHGKGRCSRQLIEIPAMRGDAK